jgi:hypothetical protein
MSAHKHRWRRLTRAERGKGWFCTYSACHAPTVWCCEYSHPLLNLPPAGECPEGRCAFHGPKAKRDKPGKVFSRWSLRMTPGQVDAVITCGKEPVLHVYAPLKNFGRENAPRLVRALNAAHVTLPKARKR